MDQRSWTGKSIRGQPVVIGRRPHLRQNVACAPDCSVHVLFIAAITAAVDALRSSFCCHVHVTEPGVVLGACIPGPTRVLSLEGLSQLLDHARLQLRRK